jgi:hypothetical protein
MCILQITYIVYMLYVFLSDINFEPTLHSSFSWLPGNPGQHWKFITVNYAFNVYISLQLDRVTVADTAFYTPYPTWCPQQPWEVVRVPVSQMRKLQGWGWHKLPRETARITLVPCPLLLLCNPAFPLKPGTVSLLCESPRPTMGPTYHLDLPPNSMTYQLCVSLALSGSQFPYVQNGGNPRTLLMGVHVGTE